MHLTYNRLGSRASPREVNGLEGYSSARLIVHLVLPEAVCPGHSARHFAPSRQFFSSIKGIQPLSIVEQIPIWTCEFPLPLSPSAYLSIRPSLRLFISPSCGSFPPFFFLAAHEQPRPAPPLQRLPCPTCTTVDRLCALSSGDPSSVVSSFPVGDEAPVVGVCLVVRVWPHPRFRTCVAR